MASELLDLPSPEPGKLAGVALTIPAVKFPSASPPAKIPHRVRQRLSLSREPMSAKEIEAKLSAAYARRQVYLEALCSKARVKARSSPLLLSSEDRGQRLQEKLRAAGEKRYTILKKTRMRLSELDELRQSVKLSASTRVAKRSEEVGAKVSLRIQQAEANRKLLLQANAQRLAAAKNKAAKVIMQNMFREKAYGESVRAAILSKRASAEKKRAASLEADKARARAIVVEARKVAESVFSRREDEGKTLKKQLVDRLQKAQENRSKYLGLRGNAQSYRHKKCNETRAEGNFLSRKLAWCWRRFVKLKKTTLYLAKKYSLLGINVNSVKLMSFEQLASLIEASVTLQITKDLLNRLELRLTVSPNSSSGSGNVESLLKELVSTKKRRVNNVEQNEHKSKLPPAGISKIMRYSSRVLLCAYMIIGHPNAVFCGRGEAEVKLVNSAETLVREFESLVQVILDGSAAETPTGHTHSDFASENMASDNSASSSSRKTLRSQLFAFDSSWCAYLSHFVEWKIKDAKLLEEEMMKVANQLEGSMLIKSKLNQNGGARFLNHNQVPGEFQVPGNQGFFNGKVHSTNSHAVTRQLGFDLSGVTSNEGRPAKSGKGIADVRSRADHNPEVFVSHSNVHLTFKNKVTVNEIVHKVQSDSLDAFQGDGEDGFEIKNKIKETIERAFWDGITESLRQDPPDYGRVVCLVEEVRDELCEMAPKSWKGEIIDSIDVDVLHQVLDSGNLDMAYLGKILEYALGMLQKLAAPANDNEIKNKYKRFQSDLSEFANSGSMTNSLFVSATVKGLRFVLEEIQVLKEEINQSRMKIMEPILKGPAGFEYLQKAFLDKYGDPSGALVSLPLTKKWLQSVKETAEHEWQEHVKGISLILSTVSNQSRNEFPPMALRAGGAFSSKVDSNISNLLSLPIAAAGMQGDMKQICKGEKVDVLLRVGLLKLVTAIAGLTHDCLPETQHLNLLRLRGVQGQLQKIIVLSTSSLIFRQMLLTECSSTQTPGVDAIAEDAMRRLSELLDSNFDVGIPEIVQTIFMAPVIGGEDGRLQTRKDLMARMLAKSLKDDDPVFMKVSLAVYQAIGAILFSGTLGENLAEVELGRVGASMLIKKVAEAADILVVVANVSCRVHSPWYATLVTNL